MKTAIVIIGTLIGIFGLILLSGKVIELETQIKLNLAGIILLGLSLLISKLFTKKEEDHPKKDKIQPLPERKFCPLFEHKAWPKLPLDHVLNGGTGVTNFHIKETKYYLKAVQLYNNPELIILRPFGALANDKNHLGLHFIKGLQGFDLSDFWRLFAAIKYNLKDHSYRYEADIRDRYEEMATFNKFSLRKAGLLNRIN